MAGRGLERPAAVDARRPRLPTRRPPVPPGSAGRAAAPRPARVGARDRGHVRCDRARSVALDHAAARRARRRRTVPQRPLALAEHPDDRRADRHRGPRRRRRLLGTSRGRLRPARLARRRVQRDDRPAPHRRRTPARAARRRRPRAPHSPAGDPRHRSRGCSTASTPPIPTAFARSWTRPSSWPACSTTYERSPWPRPACWSCTASRSILERSPRTPCATYRSAAEEAGVTVEATIASDAPALTRGGPSAARGDPRESRGERGATHSEAAAESACRYPRGDRSALFEVTDTGTGIPADQLPFVFDRFVTAADTGGTGLGLSIAKRLVEAHGGRSRRPSVTEAARRSASRSRSDEPAVGCVWLAIGRP